MNHSLAFASTRSRRGHRHRNSAPGFSLVEVLIAAVVGALMVTTMADMSDISNKAISRGTRKQKAQAIITNKIEELRLGNSCNSGSLPGIASSYSVIAPTPGTPSTTQQLCKITYVYVDISDPEIKFERTLILRIP